MRLAMPSAFVATAILGALHLVTNTPTATTPNTTPTASSFRFTVPGTYKSWTSQRDSVKVCVELRGAQWEDCLVGHYEAKTGYRLSQVEYTTNRTKKTFKVTYSNITLPKGGKRMTKSDKEFMGVDPSVYCKMYKSNETEIVLCANGTKY